MTQSYQSSKPETLQPESGNSLVVEAVALRLDELNESRRIVGEALSAFRVDKEHHDRFGRNFGQSWDPLEEMGIVDVTKIENTSEETVHEMSMDNPVDILRYQEDFKKNDYYLDQLVGDSFLDKNNAQTRVAAALASANYTPARLPVDVNNL